MILLSHLLLKLKSILASTWSNTYFYITMVKINALLTKHLKIKANIYNEIVKMNLFLHKNKSPTNATF